MYQIKVWATAVIQIVMLMLLLSGCSRKANEEIDYGTVSNSVYKNQYFGFSVTLPKDWSLQDQKGQQRLMKKGTQLMTGDDDTLKAIVKASELQTVNLFAAFQHPLGTPVAFNPSILSIAEMTRELPGIKRGKDYFYQAKKILESSALRPTFPKDYYTENVGGREFDVMELEMTIMGKVVKQKLYCAIQKGYALCFVATFMNDEEKALLQNVLNTAVFH